MSKNQSEMDGETLRALRKQRQLTQEDLAKLMQLEARTIQRWESGAVKPSIENIQRLNELLRKADWKQHPFHQLILESDGAIAILDSFACYQMANEQFRQLYRQYDNRDVLGQFAGDLFLFWQSRMEAIAGVDPGGLAFSNISSIDYSMIDSINGIAVPLRHQIFVVRQKLASTVIVHEVSSVSHSECDGSSPKINLRTSK